MNQDDRVLTQLICDETDRIVKLVERMEEFGEERPVERGPVNVHGILDHVKRLARSGFARHIRFVENYDPSLPAVLGNRDQLVQVALNLVFPDKKTQDDYQVHPLHVDFVEKVFKRVCKKVVVYDFE